MQKTILITGSTDGIGFLTAKRLHEEGHKVIVHGRNPKKVEEVVNTLGDVDSYVADLSNVDEVKSFIQELKQNYTKIDVLINNAGIYKTLEPITKDGFDVRFVVNTIAPYLLTKELIDLFDKNSRVVSLSSAAQASVDLEAVKGNIRLNDSEAYAQSKLALTMWSNYLAKKYEDKIQTIVAVNPASFLASKMVKEAYGVSGNDINIGVDILCRASLSDEFANANGKYFDNDRGIFTNPHFDALNSQKCEDLVKTIENIS